MKENDRDWEGSWKRTVRTGETGKNRKIHTTQKTEVNNVYPFNYRTTLLSSEPHNSCNGPQNTWIQSPEPLENLQHNTPSKPSAMKPGLMVTQEGVMLQTQACTRPKAGHPPEVLQDAEVRIE